MRHSPFLQRLFGVGGRRLPLVRLTPPGADGDGDRHGPAWTPRAWLARVKRRELGQQDKCLGIAELADAISTGRRPFPPHDFILHLTELTLAIQDSGTNSQTRVLETSFEPISLPEWTRDAAPKGAIAIRRPPRDRVAEVPSPSPKKGGLAPGRQALGGNARAAVGEAPREVRSAPERPPA